MPIDPTSNNPVSRLNGAPARDSARSSERQAAKPAAGSSGASAQATNLGRVDTGDTSHDVNPARVAEIRQGIADGTLRFDSARIADGIIASARELTGEA